MVWSPGFPGKYSKNANCKWTLSSQANITLTFNLFTTERGYDYLKVYDGETTSSPLIGKYHGSVFPPPATSNSSKLYLWFKSDGSVQKAGFSAQFKGKKRLVL